MNPLPKTPPATSHPRRRHQGPLDNTWRSLHRHCHRRPPLQSLPATTEIVTIMVMGFIVAWCRLPPAAAVTVFLILVVQRRRNPTNDGINTASPPFSSLPVAVAPSLPSRSPMAPSWTGMRRRPPVRRSECRSRPRPPFRKTGQLHQRRRHGRRDASVSSPAAGVRPSLLGPPSVGQWQRQHIDADACPWCLRRRDNDAQPSR